MSRCLAPVELGLSFEHRRLLAGLDRDYQNAAIIIAAVRS